MSNTTAESPLLPFASGVLTPEHEDQVKKIRTCLTSWIEASHSSSAGAKKKLEAATEELKNLQIDAPYAYTPAPAYTFRPVILSCTKTYWLAVLAALTDEEKGEVGKRLNCIPPYGKRIPQFKGKRCVEQAAELNVSEYEGLMRTASYVLIGLMDMEVVEFWQELSEVGAMNWEERD